MYLGLATATEIIKSRNWLSKISHIIIFRHSILNSCVDIFKAMNKALKGELNRIQINIRSFKYLEQPRLNKI